MAVRAGRAVKHGAAREKMRAQKARVDPLESRVAARPVDQRVILRVQRKWMPAHPDGEVRRLGIAVDDDTVEGAGKRAFRGKNARDALEHAEIRAREVE